LAKKKKNIYSERPVKMYEAVDEDRYIDTLLIPKGKFVVTVAAPIN